MGTAGGRIRKDDFGDQLSGQRSASGTSVKRGPTKEKKSAGVQKKRGGDISGEERKKHRRHRSEN